MTLKRRNNLFLLSLFLAAPAAAAVASSCGGTTTGESGATSTSTSTSTGAASSGAGGAPGSTGSQGDGGSLFVDGGDTCVDGNPCGDGGVCAGGVCCEANKACGPTCCAAADVCSFQKCVTPGAPCVDATDCPPDEYCEYALAEEEGDAGAGDAGAPDASCQGGAALLTGKCLPKPPECAPGQDPGEPLTCLSKCEYKPPVGQFSPVLKYAWGNPAAPNTMDSVMMAPIVIELDDDTCDGVVDERDIPEIVFLTFTSGKYNENGTLHAISIVNGAVVEKWTANAGATSPNHPGRSIAAGNIDGNPGNEIVVCTTDGRVRAYTAQGTELWLSANAGTCTMPSIADLDQDGQPEVIVDSQIIDGKTGANKATFTPANAQNVVVSDMDGDGKLDIVAPDRIFKADGTLLVNTNIGGRHPAIGDLDKDGVPEVVVSDYLKHRLFIWHLDPNEPNGYKVIRQNIDINGTLNPALCNMNSAGFSKGGGPPTVADFNGDGFPDVALAGGVGYAVFDGTKLMNAAVDDAATLLWSKQTQDCSSAATGSSVFDFEGDGKAEVIYGDELKMHVYAGTTGADLFETCNTNGTLFEYPLVADVDNDGQADIIVVSNSYSGFQCAGGGKTAGVRIYGDANGNWVRTRRIWNQHAYHVTNVNEDGSIPAVEPPNYKQPKLNNFRQNVQPTGEFSAPDLVVEIFPTCGVSYALAARVRNIGEAAVPAGVPVGFYVGDPANGGMELEGSPVATSKVLYPAEAVDVILSLPNPPKGVIDGTSPIFAVADDKGMHAWHECRTDNNVSPAGSGLCKGGPN